MAYHESFRFLRRPHGTRAASAVGPEMSAGYIRVYGSIRINCIADGILENTTTRRLAVALSLEMLRGLYEPPRIDSILFNGVTGTK